MSDEQPKSYGELAMENAALRATVGRLDASNASLSSALIGRDSELAQLRKPKAPPRILDISATDRFQRPTARRAR